MANGFHVNGGLFLDSSDPKEIAELWTWGACSGVTTNPLILAREGAKDLQTRVRQVLDACSGHVSVQLTEGTIDEALRYYTWDKDRIVVKVPFSERGLMLIASLSGRGIPTNATCLMSSAQAYLAACAGATYVSLFSGRVKDMGYAIAPVIIETRSILERARMPAKIIVGSIRQVSDVMEALAAGAHYPTVTPKILRAMAWNPRTESTIQEFNEAWAKR